MTNIIQSITSPFVLANQNSSVSNVTGNGTNYTAVFNIITQGGNLNTSTGVFTCTVAGTFLFICNPEMTSLNSSATNGVFTLATTGGSYTLATFNIGAWRSQAVVGMQAVHFIVPMSVNDTASITIQVSGTTQTIGFGNGVPDFVAWRLF